MENKFGLIKVLLATVLLIAVPKLLDGQIFIVSIITYIIIFFVLNYGSKKGGVVSALNLIVYLVLADLIYFIIVFAVISSMF